MGLTRPIWRISPDGERVWLPSMAAAAKGTHYGPAGFQAMLKNSGMSVGGYKWEFDEAAPRVHITHSKPVTVCFPDGRDMEFGIVRAAAQSVGINYSTLINRMQVRDKVILPDGTVIVEGRRHYD